MIQMPLVMKTKPADPDDAMHELEMVEVLEQVCVEGPGENEEQGGPGNG